MTIQQEVLKAALRICRERGGWTFKPDEVVRALPHLNSSSVRTHVVSRCCVNAPRWHSHRWGYFKRVGRGLYEIEPQYRRTKSPPSGGRGKSTFRQAALIVAEDGVGYARGGRTTVQDTIHAVVQRDGGAYVGQCLEIAVVTQGRSLDELVTELREAIELHLEGEDRAEWRLSKKLRLSITYELQASPDDA
jgi:predicted RNase H-like HicB family nuclease